MGAVTSETLDGETGSNREIGKGVSREEMFKLLSNRRRRHTMHYLRQQGRPVDLRELSLQLSAWENETDPDAITHKERKRVYTALRQTHLPKMDDVGVVEYDPARGTIEPTPEMENVEIYLDVVEDNGTPRSEYYLALSAVSVALLTVAGVGITPFDRVPVLGWAFLVVGLFAVSSAIDVYYDRERRLGGEGTPPGVDDDLADDDTE